MRSVFTLALVVAVHLPAWALCAARMGRVRQGLLAATVLCGTWLLVVTELLSPLLGIRPLPLLAAWLGAAAVLIVLAVRDRARIAEVVRGVPTQAVRASAVLAAVTVPTAVVALTCAPNAWDSLTYHLPRIARWDAHGTVAMYATEVDRQLWSQPFAEYIGLHLLVLSGDDYLLNLVQWASYVIAAVAASVLAAHLGVSGRGQLLAALLVLTLPMAVLEASTTQNDLVPAAFGMAALALLPPEAELSARGLRRAALVGSALGLAALTKFTMAFFLWPFLLVWAVRQRRRLPALAAQVGVMAGIALVIVAPFAIRVTTLFGSPFGRGADLVGTPDLGFGVLVENLVRDIGVNLASPWDALNAAVEVAVVHGLDAIGLSATRPGNTLGATTFDVVYAINEGIASNLLFMLLSIAALAGVAWSARLRSRIGGYALCTVAGLLTFAALVAWQPWVTRLLVPWFLLAAVVVAAVMDRLPRRVSAGVAALLVVSALPAMTLAETRPLIGPASVLLTDHASEYFRPTPDRQATYTWAVDRAVERDVHDIVVVQEEWNSVEYPLWALLRERGSTAQLREQLVTNASRELVSRRTPEMYLCLIPCATPPSWVVEQQGEVTVALPPDES